MSLDEYEQPREILDLNEDGSKKHIRVKDASFCWGFKAEEKRKVTFDNLDEI